jgi:hypothetical protein
LIRAKAIKEVELPSFEANERRIGSPFSPIVWGQLSGYGINFSMTSKRVCRFDHSFL